MRTCHVRIAAVYVTCIALTTACNALTGSDELPAGVKDPANFRTAEAALGAHRATRELFQQAVGSFVFSTGILTDELSSVGSWIDSLDARSIARNLSTRDYPSLQKIRGQAQQARGALAAYAPAAPSSLRGEMFLMEGLSEVMLSDLYCSGIPLSTVDFERDFTYAPGSSTDDVLRHAVTHFDSALALSGDSARVLNMARIGKARALLRLGEYQAAAAAVGSVPTAFQTQIVWNAATIPNATGVTMTDAEGGRGLLYLTGSDARTAWVSAPADGVTGQSRFIPAKYAPEGTAVHMVVASGIEARLIEAEAALAKGDTIAWAQTLNTLRESAGAFAVPAIAPIPPLPADSTTGASATLRQNVTFHERAYWLHVTGQRQGDLRRLVRHYHRRADDVYPSQGRTVQGALYGHNAVLPITSEMEGANPLFTGCLSYEP